MIDLKKLVDAGVHFGHHTSRWHPKMRPYIWGARNKTHLINVAKTAFLLDRAEKFLQSIAESGKEVLWVGTKKPAQDIIRAAGTKLQLPYVAHRWIGGTLSNFDQVKKAVTRLLHLRDVQAKADARYTKKEHSVITKEIERLERNIAGIVDMKSLPAALVVVDAKKERSAINEANVMGIPVVCIVDTNTDPSGVSYLIPANDDSPRSLTLLIESLANATEKGLEKARKAAQEAAQKAAAEKEARKKAATAEKAEKAQLDATTKAVEVEVPAVKEVKKAAPAKKAAPKAAAKPAAKKPAAKSAPKAKAAE